jgi:hypothetical protein
MPIRKKDRSFDDILNDVVMSEVPVQYISEITVILRDGRTLTFAAEDINDMDNVKNILERKGLEDYSKLIADVQITMDSQKLKENVTGFVSALLEKHLTENTQTKGKRNDKKK